MSLMDSDLEDLITEPKENKIGPTTTRGTIYGQFVSAS
jgi:hypothetical protein